MDATLEKWLSDPDLVVPENNMSFSVPKAEERRDLIAYLKRGSQRLTEARKETSH
jgi:cytochrome c